MTHRYGCDLPAPTTTTSRLSDGTGVRIDRCGSCGAQTFHREDDR